ncbi:MAG: heavy metal translocating P-type ATPase [Bacillota bacterium]
MNEKTIKANNINCAGCCGPESYSRTKFTINPDLAGMIASIVLFAVGFAAGGTLSLVLFMVSWLGAGFGVLRKAVSNLVKGRVFDENLLMTAASIGAFITGQYEEAAAVMLFYKLGIILENKAVRHSRKTIAALVNLKPETASVKTENGFIEVNPEMVKAGDIIRVKPGERIPVDSTVMEGESLIDVSPLTGESMPLTAEPGTQVLGGAINKTGLLILKALNTLKQSAVTRILELVEDAAARKAPLETFISRFAGYYTPAVIAAAFLVAVLPPLATGSMDFKTWLYRAMIFLVISCPCALVVSIPLTFFAGIGRASSGGILVKGGNYLEALNKVDTVVFDKTGTLTEGSFSVSGLRAAGCTEAELLEYAAYAEANSTHPIARSIVESYEGNIDTSLITAFEETAGKGVKVAICGKTVIAGNMEYLESFGIRPEAEDTGVLEGTVIHVSVDREYMGWISVSDKLKKDAGKAITELKKSGVGRVILLTGDAKQPAEAIASQLGIDEVHFGLLPHQKAEWLEKIKKSAKGKTIFIGDGINDAPVLASADIGISMGGIGSDAAIEASDIVLMTDEPSKITEALKIAAATHKIAVQNIVFAISVKALVLFMGTLGLSAMWEAVFADVGVTLLSVLNSLRVRAIR